MPVPEIQILAARPGDAAELTHLALAAKAHWGYPPHWIERWRAELAVTPAYLAANPTFVARMSARTAGFCALCMEGPIARLDHLWVLPLAWHRGLGRALFNHAETAARSAGATLLRIVGDPHAEGFYRRMGATRYGSLPAPMDGQPRHLPLLEKRLQDTVPDDRRSASCTR